MRWWDRWRHHYLDLRTNLSGTLVRMPKMAKCWHQYLHPHRVESANSTPLRGTGNLITSRTYAFVIAQLVRKPFILIYFRTKMPLIHFFNKWNCFKKLWYSFETFLQISVWVQWRSLGWTREVRDTFLQYPNWAGSLENTGYRRIVRLSGMCVIHLAFG